jgi:TonB family protein
MSVGAVSVLACSGVGLAAGVLPLHRAPDRSPAAQRPAAHQEPGAASLRHVHEISEASVPVLRVQPVYPDGAAAAGVQGPVVLRVNCDASGTPAGVEATHGAPELTQAAIDALYQWRFEPAGEPRTFVIGVNVVPPVADDTLPSVPPARISRDVRPPTKIADVRPVYPVEAKEAGIQGIVIGEAQIGADGVVRDVRVLRSTAGLDEAAVAAVLQWRFTQTFVDGKAVPVLMTVTVNFTLAK